MKAQELMTFLEQFAAAKAKQPASSADGSQAKPKNKKELPRVYKELTLPEFEGLQDMEDAWLVAFSAGGAANRDWQFGSLQCQLCDKHVLPSGVACWSGSMSLARSASAVTSHAACRCGPLCSPHHSTHVAGSS